MQIEIISSTKCAECSDHEQVAVAICSVVKIIDDRGFSRTIVVFSTGQGSVVRAVEPMASPSRGVSTEDVILSDSEEIAIGDAIDSLFGKEEGHFRPLE